MCRQLSVSDVCDDDSHMFMCGIYTFSVATHRLLIMDAKAIHKVWHHIAIISVWARYPWKTEKASVKPPFRRP